MSMFNNCEYETLISDLIGDVYYSSMSYRGKIATLRQYAEVVIRKLLDINPDQQITLGQPAIQKIIKDRIRNSDNRKIFQNAIEKVKTMGNSATHTQFRGEVTEDEFDTVSDGIFDLLACFFIDYFDKYKFGSRKKIMSSFSMLPPIIRYKVLVSLYEKDSGNVAVIDKLVLAMMKACNPETALQWVENNRAHLLKICPYSDVEIDDLSKIMPELGIVLASLNSNMYLVCKDKIEKVGATIRQNGLVYSDFESALPTYRNFGHIMGETNEIKEFNDIMEFMYMGRKERSSLCSNVNSSTTVLNSFQAAE